MKNTTLMMCLIAALAIFTSQVVVGQDLNGRWYHDGKPTNISVSSDGRNVTITNEQGKSSSGSMSGNKIVLSSGITGDVSQRKRRVSWNNGTEWRR
jgi:hypothetical protein